MKPPTELVWLFLDLNSYFASVEQQEDPRLRGRPVVVVPVADTDYTSAIAASKEAKAYGIKTGTMIGDAKRMCPKLVCVPAHHSRYVTYHHKILEEVIRHVPITKVWSIDELSSRLPPRFQNREEATAVARRIKEGLRKNIGECITCSIGIAPNGYLGKMASDMQKPDGLVVLEPDTMKEKLLALKLRDMPGVGHNMEIRLRNAGILTMADLWNASPKQARQAWGSVEGERMWYRLRGYDFKEEGTNPSVIGHSRVLDPELRNPEAARLVARRLTIKAASRLRRKEFHATLFDLSIRTAPDETRWAAQAQMQAAQDNMAFLGALDQLWAAMKAEIHPRAIKKVSISMHGLHKNGEITNDLFAFASQSQTKATQRSETISKIMDSINEKYGAESIKLGPSPQTSAGYVGTKIAFSRIPDIEEFHE